MISKSQDQLTKETLPPSLLLLSLSPVSEVLQSGDFPFSIQKCDARGGLEGI